MKKLALSLFFVLITNTAYAGSCPMLWGEVDSKLSKIKELRDAGKKAHDSGDHAKSEELLNKALSMLNN